MPIFVDIEAALANSRWTKKAFNSATDAYLAAFPTHLFWGLNMKLRAKVGLVILFGLGILCVLSPAHTLSLLSKLTIKLTPSAMAASIVRTIEVRVLAHPADDPTAVTVTLDRWLYIETCVVIITASLPCVRSLLKTANRQNHRRRRTEHELRSWYRGNSSPYLGNKQRPLNINREYVKCDGDNNLYEDDILR